MIEQDADMVDQMRAEKKGMQVTTQVNEELDFNANAERDAAQLQQAADGLAEQAE